MTPEEYEAAGFQPWEPWNDQPTEPAQPTTSRREAEIRQELELEAQARRDRHQAGQEQAAHQQRTTWRRRRRLGYLGLALYLVATRWTTISVWLTNL